MIPDNCVEAAALDPVLVFFWLGSSLEAEARGHLGTTYRVLLVGCSSAAFASDFNPGAAFVLLAFFSGSLSASMYSLFPRIRLLLEPDLTLYDDLIS